MIDQLHRIEGPDGEVRCVRTALLALEYEPVLVQAARQRRLFVLHSGCRDTRDYLSARPDVLGPCRDRTVFGAVGIELASQFSRGSILHVTVALREHSAAAPGYWAHQGTRGCAWRKNSKSVMKQTTCPSAA
jgi:hypothetical protein